MKLTGLFLATAAAAAAITAAPTASASVTTWDACPQGEFCLFENTDGAGRYATFKNGHKYLDQMGFEDKASSVWNRYVNPICLYEHGGYGGRSIIIKKGGKGNLNGTVNGFYWNDKVSSTQSARWSAPPRNPAAGQWVC